MNQVKKTAAHEPDSSEEIAMRAALASAIDAWLGQSGLTQSAAAARLGTTQARLSEIKHGKTAHFSLDLLVRLAARAGLAPRLSLAAPAPGSASAAASAAASATASATPSAAAGEGAA